MASTDRPRRDRKQRQPFTPEIQPTTGKRSARTRAAAPEVDKWLQFVRRVQAELAKIRFSMTLQAAYEGDGWRNGNAEKNRPVGELISARKAAVKAKHRIRQLLQEVDSESADHRHWNAWGPDKSPSASRAASRGLTRPGDGEAAKEAEGDGGSIDAEDITCSRCGGADAEDGNDILLCDYAPCGLAYHQRCCDPPLTGGEADLPAEDADWLCPRCTCLVTCVATIAEELSGFVGDDEAAAASGGASPHPLAPPRLCEHWDDVFDDVDAEAAAIASEEAEYAESRRRLLASAPLSSDDSSDGDDGGGDEVALLKQEQLKVAGDGHDASDEASRTLAAGGGRPPRRAAAAAATAKIAAELGAAAAAAPPASAEVIKTSGKRRREDADAVMAAPDELVGDSGPAAAEDGGCSDDTSDCSFPSPPSAARASSDGDSRAEESGWDHESGASEEASSTERGGDESGSDEGSGKADNDEGSPASPVSPGHVVGGFSLRSRRRPVDYVALARSMYGDAAAAPGRDIDAEEGDDDWQAGRT